MHRLISKLTALFIIVACCCFTASGQQDAGTITGIVFDASGAVLPRASVTLRNTGTGLTRAVKSGDHGQFVFTPLQVGTYEVTVEADGFETQVRSNLELQVQQTLNLDVPLKVGSATQKIEVDSSAVPALQTEESSLGVVIDTKQVENLPLNGRNVYQLVSLTPGVAVDPSGRAAVSGQASQNQYYGIDGVDNNNYSGTLASGQAYSLSPSPDAVQEFKVQTNNYSAEFGQSAGGVVNVITKSGTNQMHGSLYEFVRSQSLDAVNYFALNRPPYLQNQFGGSLGGPIVIPKVINGHDKLFFFVDYEGFRSQAGLTQNVLVAPTAWRTGDLSSYLTGTPYTDPCTGSVYDTGQLFDPTSTRQVNCADGSIGNVRTPISYQGHANVINPASISAPAAAATALIPQPNSGGNQFIWSPTNTLNFSRGDAKVDYQWGSHDHFFVRYGIIDTPLTGVPQFPSQASGGTVTVQRQQGIAASDTHIFGPNVVNEVRYAWSHNNTDVNLAASTLQATTLGFGGVPYQAGLLGGLPGMNFSDGGSIGDSIYAPTLSNARDQEITDTLSLVRGAHQFKIGGAVNHYGWLQYLSQFPVGNYNFTGALTKSLTAPSSVTDAASTGSGFAQFLYGIPDFSGLSSSITSNNYRTTGAVFVQDDWKVSPKLTVNLGLRWEFGTGLEEAQNRVAGVDTSNGYFELPKSREGLSPSLPAGLPVEYVNSNTLMEPGQRNFGPRIGVAYKLDPQTVLRAAFGIFYANPFPAGTLGYPLNPPFGVATYVQAPATGPISPSTGQPVVPVTNISSGFPSTLISDFDPATLQIFLYAPKPKMPTTNNWSAAVQRALPGGTSLEVAYAGSTSAHVNAGVDLNQPYPTADPNSPPQSRRPFPNLGILASVNTAANGNYNSLQTKFEKRYSNGLTFLFAYTWSHSIDDAPSNITLGTGSPGGNLYDFYRNPRDPSLDTGDSYFDIRHRVTFNAYYQLPIGRGRLIGNNFKGWENQILGDWQLGGILAYQTGYHFSVITYDDPSNSDIYSYAGAAYPDLVGKLNDFSSCPGGHKSINCWFNVNAFAPSQPGQFGNEPRNFIVGPNNFDIDFSTLKNFPITERVQVQFRGEVFNLTNHPNFTLPANNAQAGNFGQITATTGNPREIQLALRLQF
jgi:Carboxypeptidase regulatory-like domain